MEHLLWTSEPMVHISSVAVNSAEPRSKLESAIRSLPIAHHRHRPSISHFSSVARQRSPMRCYVSENLANLVGFVRWGQKSETKGIFHAFLISTFPDVSFISWCFRIANFQIWATHGNSKRQWAVMDKLRPSDTRSAVCREDKQSVSWSFFFLASHFSKLFWVNAMPKAILANPVQKTLLNFRDETVECSKLSWTQGRKDASPLPRFSKDRCAAFGSFCRLWAILVDACPTSCEWSAY